MCPGRVLHFLTFYSILTLDLQNLSSTDFFKKNLLIQVQLHTRKHIKENFILQGSCQHFSDMSPCYHLFLANASLVAENNNHSLCQILIPL